MIPIKVGLGILESNIVRPKRQTIRASGKRRHAEPGQEIQLYYGMRTKQCELIGRAVCVGTAPILIRFRFASHDDIRIGSRGIVFRKKLDAFAMDDGFSNWRELRRFWIETHGEALAKAGGIFEGTIVYWEPMK